MVNAGSIPLFTMTLSAVIASAVIVSADIALDVDVEMM